MQRSHFTVHEYRFKHTIVYITYWVKYVQPVMYLQARSQWLRFIFAAALFFYPRTDMFQLDRCFESGDYHFITRGSIINNCDYYLRRLHAYRIKDSKTKHQICSIVLILCLPLLARDLAFCETKPVKSVVWSDQWNVLCRTKTCI